MTQELTDRWVIAIPDKLLLWCKAVAGDEGSLEKLSEFVGDHSPMRLTSALDHYHFFSSPPLLIVVTVGGKLDFILLQTRCCH